MIIHPQETEAARADLEALALRAIDALKAAHRISAAMSRPDDGPAEPCPRRVGPDATGPRHASGSVGDPGPELLHDLFAAACARYEQARHDLVTAMDRAGAWHVRAGALIVVNATPGGMGVPDDPGCACWSLQRWDLDGNPYEGREGDEEDDPDDEERLRRRLSEERLLFIGPGAADGLAGELAGELAAAAGGGDG